jgi:hypothetical protein
VKRVLLALVICGSPWCVVSAQTADPLQARVSIEYRDAPAVDVINALAAAAGLNVEIEAGALRPVTITLTNVRLSTALAAVCENAACVWRLQGPLRVSPAAARRPLSLPKMISFEVYDVSPHEVFRALAAALDVPLSLETSLSNEPSTIRLRNAAPADALNLLCSSARCQWRFDPDRGLRVIAAP